MNTLERVLSIVLTVATLTVALVVVRREFSEPLRAGQTVNIAAPTGADYFKGWMGLLRHGIIVGDSAAPVKIVEFVDLECPFCRRYQATLQRVADQFGSAVSLVFLHYPLDMHRFARPAAQASECAERQGRFREFVEAAYAKQDSFGLKAWVSVAREAGVPDTAGFLRCLEGAPATRIDSARAAGEGIPVRGTPTLVVNGWTFRSPPPESELVRVITELLAGREPFESTVGVVRDGAR